MQHNIVRLTGKQVADFVDGHGGDILIVSELVQRAVIDAHLVHFVAGNAVFLEEFPKRGIDDHTNPLLL